MEYGQELIEGSEDSEDSRNLGAVRLTSSA